MTDEERESKQGSIDIRKLPGYEVNIRLTSFIDAILVCNANAVSFRKWHDKINTPALVVMLKEPANYSLRHETNLELQRQFSNFLMSAFAVRDHWYALRNEYYIGTGSTFKASSAAAASGNVCHSPLISTEIGNLSSFSSGVGSSCRKPSSNCCLFSTSLLHE